MPEDIAPILADWPYNPDKNVRIVRLADDREVLQVRIDQGALQGILQMDLDGRPDGICPHGHAFWLDYFHERLKAYVHRHQSDDDFRLNHVQCGRLFEESQRVYQRYIFLLQLQDFPRVIRDTQRNMDLFRFVNRYADSEDDRMTLEKWWPYILRVNSEARALAAVDAERYEEALSVIHDARTRIETLDEVDAEEFYHERARSIQALAEMEKAIQQGRPLSTEERLEKQLREAVNKEEFETAAVLRDRLESLRHGGG